MRTCYHLVSLSYDHEKAPAALAAVFLPCSFDSDSERNTRVRGKEEGEG